MILADAFNNQKEVFEVGGSAPKTVAFLGKRAAHALLPGVNLRWGPQELRIAGTPIWVLPNPSGLNRTFSLDALVAAYAELRRHVPD